MIDRKEFELLVRAQIQGGKDLESVAKSIANIGDAIKEQSDAAKRGESRIDELKGSLESLALVQKELQGQSSAIAYFRKLANSIGDSEARVKKATDRYVEYNKKLEESGERTEKQQQTLIRYSLAVDKANKALERQRGSLASMEKEFRDAGVAVENLAAVQKRNEALQAELGLTYNRGKEAIKGYAAEVRKARDAQALLDKANADSARNAQLFEQAEKRAADAVAARARAAQEVADSRSKRNDESAVNRRVAAEEEQQLRRGRELAALRQDIIQRSEAQAKANLEAARTAKLFEEAERKAANAAKARADAAREVDATRSLRSGEVAAARRLDAEEAERVKRAQQLAALRKDIVDRSTTQALVDQADAAGKTARGYTTLARAAETLRPKTVSLKDAIGQIIDPAAKVRATLGGLEADVGKLASSIGAIKGPVQDYRGQMDQLLAAQKRLTQQASLIDGFNRQTVALREARAEFVRARADVATYAAGMAQGGEAGAQFAAKLAQAQNQLRASAQSLAQQVQATRQSREALRGAGIASNDLAASQARLNAVARQSVSSFAALEAATEKYGMAVDRSKRAKIGFRDEGRTTLSYIQRLRGEVLSLVAAYGGLYTVVNTAKGAIQASTNRESAKTVLGVGLGTTDSKQIDAEYNYVKGQSDRIGLVFDQTVKDFGKFSTAAAKSGRSREEIRAIFESFAEGGTVLKLTTADMSGVFLALEQIFSKGRLGAEELRQQLGERLPGVFEVAQQALKKQFPDLNKAMEQGKVGAEQLVLVAEAYRKMVAEQLPAAQKSLVAQQNRLTNEVNLFKLAVADSGFVDSYAKAIGALTTFLRSDDGKAFAQSVGAGFKALTDLFILLLDNLNTITAALKLFLTYFAYTRFASGLKGVSEGIKSFGDLKEAIGGVGSEMTKLQKGMALVAAFFVGWNIGTWAYKEFAIVRDGSTWLVTGLMQAWAMIKASYQAALELFPEIAQRVWAKVIETIASGARKLTGIFADFARSAGFDGLADSLEGAAKRMTVGTRQNVDVVSSYRQNLEKELAGIRKIRDEMLADNKLPASVTARPVADPTKSPGLVGGDKPGGPSAGDIKKRENEIEAITKALEALDSKIDRSQTETLQKQLDAIDSQYAGLARRIEKLGGETGKAFMARLTATIQELRQVTISKFNDDLKKELDSFLKKTGDAEEQAGKRQRFDLLARQGAIISDYEQLYKELADLRLKFYENDRDTAPLDAARDRLRASEAIRLEQETTKYNLDMLNDKEQLMNDTIAARDKLLAAVNTQREVGAITDVEAAQQLNDIQGQYVPKIVAAYDATRLWAEQHKEIFGSTEAYAVFIATLDAIKAKATGVKTEFSMLNNTIIQGGVKAVDTGLNAIADGLTNIATRQGTVADGFRSMLMGFAQFAASFLRDIALMIIKLAIFNAMKNSGKPYLIAAGTAGAQSMGVKHSGGVMGHYNNGNRTRNISAPAAAAWAAGAPRYHSGGVMGLASDEYATILQRGEEVLSADSPRNIMNGGGVTTGGGQDPGTRIVLVDDRARVPEAMNSPDGERVIMAAVKKNISTVKQWTK